MDTKKVQPNIEQYIPKREWNMYCPGRRSVQTAEELEK
jgi:hypothetical protein